MSEATDDRYGAAPAVPYLSIPVSEFENLHEQIRLRGEMIAQLQQLAADAQAEIGRLRHDIELAAADGQATWQECQRLREAAKSLADESSRRLERALDAEAESKRLAVDNRVLVAALLAAQGGHS